MFKLIQEKMSCVLSGIRSSLHANEAWGARLTFTLSSCLRLETASVGTNMIFICHQHGKLSRQRQHRRMVGKEYGTSVSSEQNDFAFGTVKVPFASYGRRGPAARAGERTVRH